MTTSGEETISGEVFFFAPKKNPTFNGLENVENFRLDGFLKMLEPDEGFCRLMAGYCYVTGA